MSRPRICDVCGEKYEKWEKEKWYWEVVRAKRFSNWVAVMVGLEQKKTVNLDVCPACVERFMEFMGFAKAEAGEIKRRAKDDLES